MISLVVNASRKEIDFAHIAEHLPSGMRLEPEPDRGLFALQGPQAAAMLSRLIGGAGALGFMKCGVFQTEWGPLVVSRSGYTGEDGFEISVEASAAKALARQILAQPEVLPVGLGARDTLRLEAGLPLYGQDLDEAASPVEAGLAFSIGRRRRAHGGFAGAKRVLRELAEGPERLRVGLKLEGRAAARHGMTILDAQGEPAGEITSGAFTPSAAASIAMGYVPSALSKTGTRLAVSIRRALVPAQVVNLPFIPHRYVRKG
jgi:aminomethyltransferase